MMELAVAVVFAIVCILAVRAIKRSIARIEKKSREDEALFRSTVQGVVQALQQEDARRAREDRAPGPDPR